MNSRIGLSMVAALLVCGQAWAQTTWTLTTGTVTANLVSATSTGYSNSVGTGNTQIETGTLTLYGGGLGLRNNDEDTSQPNHAIDNYGRQDMVLVSFSKSVNLTGFRIGYPTSGCTVPGGTYSGQACDSDMTVLAYTGAAPTPPLAGLTWGDLTANGWTLVGHYANVPVGSSTGQATGTSVSSSYWLVGAYNFLINPTGLTEGNDFVKLLAVVGNVKEDIPGVPEPGSLALFALASLGMLSVSRRRKV